MYDNTLLEEEIKNRVGQDFFPTFDTTAIVGRVDFCVAAFDKFFGETLSFLWAEAKRGTEHNIQHSLVQLILTIGKERTFDRFNPPPFLGAFDAEKIAFLPYSELQEIFYQNDFNWQVAPSNHQSREFKLLLERVQQLLEHRTLLFYFAKDRRELKAFIRENFIYGNVGTVKLKIDKNNFISVYSKWLQSVKPTIAFNWDKAKAGGIIDADFYLADLLSSQGTTLQENLFVVLKATHYEMNRHQDEFGAFTSSSVQFNDSQKAYNQFWNKYERPPKEEYWDYIIERRDLLVPQDVRERKGSYFTPSQWVELSQRYLADIFGENWQDEYYVWDCAAGTGNLLAGLTNKYNIFASTLDMADVKVMKERAKSGANLLEDYIFQFDFLNDDLNGEKVPADLRAILTDPEKRKKLIVYINPPYAEATTATTITGTGANKSGVSNKNKTYITYKDKIGKASNELFAQFLIRIYTEIPNAKIAEFSTLKILQSSNLRDFRREFRAKLEKFFLVPANTFDNVKGQFPIGFMIWNPEIKEVFTRKYGDIYLIEKEKSISFFGKKQFYGDLPKTLNEWQKTFKNKGKNESIVGLIVGCPPDYQHNTQVALLSKAQERYCFELTIKNLIQFVVYFSVRLCMEATWLNDRDQFLYPKDGWQTDTAFQNDCLTFTLFHGQNRITVKEGVNHWIPFREAEVNAPRRFESHFMSDFIAGKISIEQAPDLFNPDGKSSKGKPLQFSEEAQAVFTVGKALWQYYMQQPDADANAALYDIRDYFQGRNEAGRMNSSSEDETYTQLIKTLRENLKELAEKIIPKVYEYGFLMP